MKKILLLSAVLSLPLFLGLSGRALAEEGHKHVSDLPMNVQWGLQGAKELINIHPLFVHFPIALLLTSTAFYFLGTIFKKADLLAAAKWALYFGTLASAVTVWTGLKAAETVAHGGDTHQIMMVHQYLGFAVLGLSLALSAWVFFSKASIPGKGKPVFLLALVVLAAVLTQGADLGGRMVFLHGTGVGKKSMMQEEAHGHEAMGEHEDGHDHRNHHH